MNLIWLFVGPSGVGKTTLLKYLASNNLLEEVISTTTRKPRAGEKNGVDYKFVSRGKFQRLRQEQKFVEYVQIGEEFYGILYGDVLLKLHRTDVGIVVEPNGVKQIRKKFGNRVQTVFLKELDQTLLDRRMIERGDSLQSILDRRRLDESINLFEYQAEHVLTPDSIENLALKFKELQSTCFRQATDW